MQSMPERDVDPRRAMQSRFFAAQEEHPEVPPEDGSDEVAMAQALANLCSLAQARSRGEERLRAARDLLQKIQVATPTAQASLRVLWTELKSLRRCRFTKEEALKLQLLVAERARVAFGWTLRSRGAKKSPKESDQPARRARKNPAAAAPAALAVVPDSGLAAKDSDGPSARGPVVEPAEISVEEEAPKQRSLEERESDSDVIMEIHEDGPKMAPEKEMAPVGKAKPFRQMAALTKMWRPKKRRKNDSAKKDKGKVPGTGEKESLEPAEKQRDEPASMALPPAAEEDQADSDVIVEHSHKEELDWSRLGDLVSDQLFHCKGAKVSGCPWCERRGAKVEAVEALTTCPRHPCVAFPQRYRRVQQSHEAPESLEALQQRCEVYRRQGTCRHLCSELCYFREFEAARQLRALQDRAQATELPWPSWTARLALSQRAPYWCVVFHEASGAVLGSHRCAYQRLRSQLPTGALESPRWCLHRSEVNDVLESPFGLIEELLADEPWQLLTTCILLNKTGRAVVDRMLPEFLAICPGPQGLLDTAPEVLHRIFQPLGLHRKRARMLRRFSEEYMEAEREAEGDFIPLERVRRFHGVGKYASDAYEIFVLKQISTVQPTDVYLRWYREAALNTLDGNEFVCLFST